MKNSFFSKILIAVFLLGGLSVNSQVRVKKNRSNINKTTIVKKTNKNFSNREAVRVKKNRSRSVVSKPNRPKNFVRRPAFNKPGFIWVEGYWKWNIFFARYTWQKARWIKIKRNHCWVPGFWEINTSGFFWIQGYWTLEC
jgi:hypothetical protein